ncbi:MAG: hypothetical protein M0Z55_00070 [Peptococcaceae bacterium]|nr:hypothetical protein [Peptococcaceae bacterium]
MKNAEALIKEFKATGNRNTLNDIIACFRYHIQKRAFQAAKNLGLNVDDCEIDLATAVWKAAEDWDESKKGATNFVTFAHYYMDRAMTSLFGHTRRYEASHVELVYCLAEMEEEDDFRLFDPKQDIENFIAEQDAARSLAESIRSHDGTCATVAVLKATGKTDLHIADLLDYNPKVINRRKAKELWTKRKLRKAQIPARDHYKKMGMPIPIALKD